MPYKLHLALLFLLLSIGSLYSQSPFKASIMAGINLSQVDGDFQTGFDHRSINFGLRGGFSINKRIDIMSELFYNEKGVKPKGVKSNSIGIDLTYAEVPITVNIHSKINASGFYNWTFHTGLSYGRLLKSQTTVGYGPKMDSTNTQSFSQDTYKPNDFALVWGLSYNIRPHIGVRFQHSFSLNKFFINTVPKPAYDPRRNETSYRTFRNYFIAFQVYYDFFAPKMKTVKKKGKK